MKRFLSRFAILFLLLLLIVPQNISAAAASDISAAIVSGEYEAEQFSDFHRDDLTLYAASAVLIDADTGRVLYGKSAAEPMANASTTKILTCILALESGDLSDVVTVSEYACSMPKVKLGFSPGDTFYLKDLLYSLMLESHNDSAVAVAEYVAGSVEAFAELMNEKAEEIGCTDSHFVTPNGLDEADEEGEHHTTACDLSRIMAYCIQNGEFLEITRTASVQISTADGAKTYSLTNHNSLLQMMDGAISGKTGFTAKAGYCYVGACASGDHTYVFALLACGWPDHRDYKWSDVRQLVRYADENYADQVLAEEAVSLTIPLRGGVSVRDGSVLHPDCVAAVTTDEVVSGFVSETDEITVSYDLPESLDAPVREGSVIGEEKIYLNGVLYAVREVALTESADRYDFSWCLKFVFHAFALRPSLLSLS
ncbi:MAG: D-alanyl-D-alanine carboxypeptidase [Clostridiales bacterium]|nr:D-alanyl-D-alanine carboxypeptidase [Clostridiales bacterium]